VVVGLLTDSDQVANNALRDWKTWTKHLSETTAVRDAVTWPLIDQQEIFVVPAGTSRLTTFGGPGWLAAGDAAMTFDPLSSQGILMAMISGMEAGAAAVSAISGDTTGGGQYCRRQTARLEAYLAQRAQYYAAEQRWRDRIFWRRRHTGADALL
jgi:2-polyprenyl-6-methoxyphenol hydroxylase-like FAD-dependent oxidoreductase